MPSPFLLEVYCGPGDSGNGKVEGENRLANLTPQKGAYEKLIMKFQVTIDRDEDGVWIAECPSIPGCVSQGGSREEALGNIKDAIRLCLEVRFERGMPIIV
jgi:predicted RNase H-like HicB family nuclease